MTNNLYTITNNGITVSAPTQAEAIAIYNAIKGKATNTRKNAGKQGTGGKAPEVPEAPKPEAEKPEPKPIEWSIDGKTVKADKRMCKALYTRNKAIAIENGGVLTEGEKVFTVVFGTKAKAKAFVDKAVCILSAEEYEAARQSKGKKLSKAERHAIRSKCAKACTGKDGKLDRAKYDTMCAEHGVINGR